MAEIEAEEVERYYFEHPTSKHEKLADFLHDEFLRRLNLQDSTHSDLVLKLHTLLGFVFTITVAYLASWGIEPQINIAIKLLTNPEGFYIHRTQWFPIHKMQLIDIFSLTQIGMRVIALVFIFLTVKFIIRGLHARGFENPASPDLAMKDSNYFSKKYELAIAFKGAYDTNIPKYKNIANELTEAFKYFIISIFCIILSFLI